MKKVAIVGSASSWNKAPFNDETYEIWTLNNMYLHIPKATRWFDIHDKYVLETYYAKGGQFEHIKKLSEMTIPVYMQEVHPDIPTSVKYPLDEILKKFNRDYFRSSVDYMIALALYEGFEVIEVYGVNMAADDEYAYQKPSASYWLGRAEGMGVKIYLPDECDLLKGYFRYAYDAEFERNVRIKGNARMKELEVQSAEFSKNYYLSLGAKDTWNVILRELEGK